MADKSLPDVWMGSWAKKCDLWSLVITAGHQTLVSSGERREGEGSGLCREQLGEEEGESERGKERKRTREREREMGGGEKANQRESERG